MIVVYIFALLASFYLLARISDKYFIPALDKIAKDLKMSNDMAGATLMAIGSSAPELFVALIAVLKPGGHVEIGMGTIVGSAIFNILVITGSIALIKTAVLNWQPVVRDFIFYAFAIISLLFVLQDWKISIYEAAFFLVFYGFYVFMVIKWVKIFPYKEIITRQKVSNNNNSFIHRWQKTLKPLDFILDRFFPSQKYYYWVFFMSIAVIGALCWVLVEGAIGVSEILNIPEVLIALIVLAIGTSVPDMMSSLIVAKQGRGGMAISNAIGSNIFDILFGLGLPWLIFFMFNDGEITVRSEDMVRSIILLLGSVITVYILLSLQKWKIGHKAGIILIALYIIYVLWEISKIYIF